MSEREGGRNGVKEGDTHTVHVHCILIVMKHIITHKPSRPISCAFYNKCIKFELLHLAAHL